MKKSPLALKELPFTGERLVTQVASENVQMVFEHLHRYFVAGECCRDKEVLDIACGEGYGSDLLAQVARSVIGVDIAAEAIKHAGRKYKRNNLRFQVGSCEKIPLAKHSIDVVVSFETIEHLRTHAAFLAEIRRVLRPNGVLIISTPDKSEYCERLGKENPFHLAELYRSEFLDLLKRTFRNCRSLQQRLVGGSYIAADKHVPGDKTVYGTHRGDFQSVTFTEGVHAGLYVVAICSDGPVPPLRLGLMENLHESARMWHAYETARNIREELNSLRARLETSESSLSESLKEREKLEAAIQLSRSELDGLQKHAKWLDEELVRVREIAAEAAAAPANSSGGSELEWLALKTRTEAQEKLIASLDAEVVKRGEWGKNLSADLLAARERIAHLDKLLETSAAHLRARDSELSQLNASAQALRSELHQENRRIADAEVAVEELRRENVDLEMAKRTLEQKLSEANAAALEREKISAAAKAELLSRTEIAERALSESNSALDTLHRKHADLELVTQELERKSKEIQAAMAAAADRESALTIACNDLRQRNEAADRLLAEGSTAKIALLQSRSLLEREVLTRGKRVLELEDELGNARNHAASLEATIRELETNMAKLQTTLATTQHRNVEHEANVAKHSQLSVENESLRTELAQLRAQLAANEQQAIAIEGASKEINRLSGLLNEEKFEVAQSIQKYQSAQRQVVNLEEQLAHAQSLVTDLGREADRATRWGASLDQLIQREREQFEKLNREFIERTNWALSLRDELEALRPRQQYLEGKVNRMQNSFSWRSTAVFRALRRLFGVK